ncbi:pilin [Nocardia sp. CDC160]|uniref:pilin n=1 Tax=Nocardia sp. CDC160 TaxID=3112166 RepID=UPI002DB83315|nr:pilin [Nocardia sp. CDC160]MEC3915513.1 pilin [Nocardia sp. CDC160]
MRVTPVLPSFQPRGRARSARSTKGVTRTLVCAFALGCALAYASGSAAAQPVSILAVAGSFQEVLDNLRNWLIGILATIATVCLTIGGTRYLICSGDPGEVERAKVALKAACIGYALAMLAPLVVAVLKSIVGG